MDTTYIPSLAALTGTVVVATALLATTWLTQHRQERATRLAQEINRRERLYGEFVDVASRLLADALTHHLEAVDKMVPLYAIVGKLRLFALAAVVARADEVMGHIVEIYDLPNGDFRSAAGRPAQNRVDILRVFCEACREDLRGYSRRGAAAAQRTSTISELTVVGITADEHARTPFRESLQTNPTMSPP